MVDGQNLLWDRKLNRMPVRGPSQPKKHFLHCFGNKTEGEVKIGDEDDSWGQDYTMLNC